MLSLSLQECADLVGGKISGDPDLSISGVNDLLAAGSTEISFATHNNLFEKINHCAAAAVVVPLTMKDTAKPLIRVKNPYLAITLLHRHFLRRPFVAEGISPHSIIGKNCNIADEVTVQHNVVIGDNVTVGKRVSLYPGVVIGDDVSVGDDVTIYPNVTIYWGCVISHRTIIHAGTVIGSDGYGYVADEEGSHIKRPHVGKVVIEEDVELGANVCVDRGTFGETRICKGAKVDNLVQIAHNVLVGENNLLVGQSGIAGSSRLGSNVVLGGNVGVAGHVIIGDNVMVAAKAGVHGDLPANTVWAGYPAIPREKWLRSSVLAAKLPDMYKELRRLKKEVERLHGELPQK